LAVRIKRAAFAMTMVTVIGLGGALLALAISEIPANRIKANEMAVNVIGEVISGDIRNQFGNLRQLSLSSLAWTALTDSAGRDAYMKPFLRSREQEAACRFSCSTIADAQSLEAFRPVLIRYGLVAW
jgi:hypothetical protein